MRLETKYLAKKYYRVGLFIIYFVNCFGAVWLNPLGAKFIKFYWLKSLISFGLEGLLGLCLALLIHMIYCTLYQKIFDIRVDGRDNVLNALEDYEYYKKPDKEAIVYTFEQFKDLFDLMPERFKLYDGYFRFRTVAAEEEIYYAYGSYTYQKRNKEIEDKIIFTDFREYCKAIDYYNNYNNEINQIKDEQKSLVNKEEHIKRVQETIKYEVDKNNKEMKLELEKIENEKLKRQKELQNKFLED